jgi:hypothetical protein
LLFFYTCFSFSFSFTAHCPLPTAHCPLPTAHCPLPITHYPQPATQSLLATAPCPHPTTYSLPLAALCPHSTTHSLPLAALRPLSTTVPYHPLHTGNVSLPIDCALNGHLGFPVDSSAGQFTRIASGREA